MKDSKDNYGGTPQTEYDHPLSYWAATVTACSRQYQKTETSEQIDPTIECGRIMGHDGSYDGWLLSFGAEKMEHGIYRFGNLQWEYKQGNGWTCSAASSTVYQTPWDASSGFIGELNESYKKMGK